MPESETTAAPLPADLAPVPEVVAPIPPGSNLPVVQKEPISPALLHAIMAAATIFLVVFVIVWVVFNRVWIVERWPFLEPYYDIVGLHTYHYGEGLSFENVRSDLRYEGGKMLLAVEGIIHNGANTVLQIPDIKATAIGVDGKVVQSWQIAAPAAIVGPGAVQKFISSIDAPKDAVTEITLNFVETAHDNDH